MSSPHNICILAGLSGVGKTYLINQLIKEDNRFVHFSAGVLIKKRLSKVSHDELRLLSDNELLQNQYLLAEQLSEELVNVSVRNLVLFDAHMLIDTNETLFEIPFDVFSSLDPSAFIFLSEEPSTIASRRARDTSRKRPVRSEAELHAHQVRSQELALQYASALKVPFAHIGYATVKDIRRHLSEWNFL